MKSKFQILALALILLLGSILSACGSSSDKASGTNAGNENNTSTGDPWNGKTLRVSAQSWIIEKWPLEEAAKKFMEDHPGAKVEVVPAPNKGGAESYLLQWSRNKTDVDLALGGSPADIAAYVAKDVLVEFDDEFFKDFPREKFVKSFLDLGTFNEKQYSIPLLGEVIALNVRKDLMKEAGLTDASGNPIPPNDWAELYEYAKKLTVSNNGNVERYGLSIDLGTNLVNLNYYSGLQSATGHFMEENSIDFSSTASKDLLSFWKKITMDGYAQKNTLQDQNAGRNAFKSGGVAMLWTSSSRTQEFAQVLGEDKVATLPLPGATQNGSIAFTHGIFIPKASPVPDMAKAFIKEQLLGKEGQQWSAQKYGKLPTVTENYEGLPSSISQLLTQVEKSKGEPLFKEQAKLTNLIHKELSEMLVNSQDVSVTMSNISNGMKTLDLTDVGK